MGKEYLIDSNVVIDFLMGKIPKANQDLLNAIIDAVPNVSVITKIEVLGYTADPEIESMLEQFFLDSNVFGIDEVIVEKTIELRKSKKIKIPDAIIAATSLVLGFTDYQKL